MKISSQKYIDQEIVDQKIEAADYIVTLADLGNGLEMVIDGHHSLDAARQTGNSPEYVVSEYNYQAEIESLGSLDAFLEAHWIDSDWYDVETGAPAF
jgi:hypothetical protein